MDKMKKKILKFITITLLIGGAVIFINDINDIENELPAGTIKISNKVNGQYLTVKKLSILGQTSRWYNSLIGNQSINFKNDADGYVILEQNDLKGFCWLPIPQQNETTVFQYVCAGKYHNYYLDIQDNITSDRYLRLMVRQQVTSGSNWNIDSKEDGTFTYDNNQDRLKGYYIAIKADGIARVYFGDIGPNARWHQNMHQMQ
jgi:hypothetical protein